MNRRNARPRLDLRRSRQVPASVPCRTAFALTTVPRPGNPDVAIPSPVAPARLRGGLGGVDAGGFAGPALPRSSAPAVVLPAARPPARVARGAARRDDPVRAVAPARRALQACTP